MQVQLLTLSGHNMAHDLNIQAICGIDCCFTFFGFLAVQKSSDQDAFKGLSIHKRARSRICHNQSCALALFLSALSALCLARHDSFWL